MPRISARKISVRYPVVGSPVGRLETLQRLVKRRAYSHPPVAEAAAAKIVVSRDGRSRILALDDLSLVVKSGERIGILGHNGSGKTTLLRTIGGIITPESGKLDVEGSISGIFNLKLGLRIEATGRRNVWLRAISLGMTREEVDEKMDFIEAFSGLGDYLELPVSSYSSGMIMRLIFAVVVASNPEILLLDEWIGTADEAFRQKAIRQVKSETDGPGIFLIASHNTSLLNKLCDDAILMKDGRIIDRGPVKAIVKDYKTMSRA